LVHYYHRLIFFCSIFKVDPIFDPPAFCRGKWISFSFPSVTSPKNRTFLFKIQKFILYVSLHTETKAFLYKRWFKYGRHWFVCKQAVQVPVIFEPPCIYGNITGRVWLWILTTPEGGRPENRRSIPGNNRDFSLFDSVQTDSGTHPASYPIVIGVILTGIKQPEPEADNSLPFSAEVRKAYRHSCTPPYVTTLTTKLNIHKTSDVGMT
jgi:hypothetical protein